MSFGKYVLIGAGGTGSILAPYLLKQLQKHHGRSFLLTIVDGDIIEDKNVARQGYSYNQIGLAKADELAKSLNDPNVVAMPVYIDSVTAQTLIREQDTVLIAVDNYRARADIERRAFDLSDVTIINGGNEATTASCQIYLRRNGRHVTPPISYQHPEILTPELSRSEESCLVRASSPEDEQTIGANLMSAAWMLAAVSFLHRAEQINAQYFEMTGELNLFPEPLWHELHADLYKGKANGPDWRDMGSDAWKTYVPEPLDWEDQSTSPDAMKASDAFYAETAP